MESSQCHLGETSHTSISGLYDYHYKQCSGKSPKYVVDERAVYTTEQLK